MASRVNIDLVFNHLPALAAELHHQVGQVVRKTAFDIQRDAMGLAAVDTGAMKNAVYVETSGDSSYGEAASAAEGMNPEGTVLSEVQSPPDDLTAIVAEAMSYGAYQEMGTVRMAAHPYMTPAAEANRQPFLSAMSRLLE
ncbi:MAG: hypothetical protein ACRDF8_08130 [Chloroflexota bacterium]